MHATMVPREVEGDTASEFPFEREIMLTSTTFDLNKSLVNVEINIK